MAKSTSSETKLITQVPLTAEARERFLSQLFAEDLPHAGELFIPDDTFYKYGNPRSQAEHMTKELCAWLGIKPGYIGLKFESLGGDGPDGRHYTIFVESDVLSDEFMLGGFLAYALTRYLIEHRKQIHPFETDQQISLLASASIKFGFAVVILNSTTCSYSLLWKFHRNNSVLRGFPLSNYVQMTRIFLIQHSIGQVSFSHSLTPLTEKLLGLKRSKKSSIAIQGVRHNSRVANFKFLGACWLVLLIVVIGGFSYFQRIKPVSAKLASAEQNATLLNQLRQLCKDSVAYHRQYSDISDIQTLRALSAEELRCQSLENRYNNAQAQADQLSGQH